jgi:hypothetical protein
MHPHSTLILSTTPDDCPRATHTTLPTSPSHLSLSLPLSHTTPPLPPPPITIIGGRADCRCAHDRCQPGRPLHERPEGAARGSSSLLRRPGAQGVWGCGWGGWGGAGRKDEGARQGGAERATEEEHSWLDVTSRHTHSAPPPPQQQHQQPTHAAITPHQNTTHTIIITHHHTTQRRMTSCTCWVGSQMMRLPPCLMSGTRGSCRCDV